jgi:teichuronic acid exporter
MSTLGGAELRRRAVKSTAWFGVTRIGMQVSVWLVTIVLARLLSPGDYGLFAMALSVLAFIEVFQELGLGAAIIQRQQVTREELNGIFWIVVSASALLTALVFVAADVVGALYAEPRLPGMLRVLSIAFLLNSFGMIPQTLLTKEIHLHRRSIAEGAGVIISIPIALGLAYHGYGVWALIIGHLGRAVALNITLAALARWIPGTDVSFRGIRKILNFGLHIVGGRVIATLSTAVNTAIVGLMLGGRSVGLYTMTRGLADGPHRISTSIINQISFPIFSKIQDDRVALKRYFLSISKYLAIIALPVQVGIALVASELVPIVLSPAWSEMIGILKIFAVGAIVAVLSLPAAPLLQARGRPEAAVHFGWMSSAAMALAFLVGSTYGLGGVATAWLIVLVPARAILIFVSLRELQLSVREYLRHLLLPAVATGAMTFSVLTVPGLMAIDMSALATLAVKVCIGALAYVLVLLILDRQVSTEIKTIARDVFAASKA